MAISTVNSWQSNFYWKQELRSVYMNSIFSSIIRPGVYNPNMSIRVEPSENSSTDISLYVGQGTTFVFSNSYYSDEHGKAKRSFNTSYDDSRYSYVVKTVCVADETKVKLATLKSTDKQGDYLLVAVKAYSSEERVGQEIDVEPSFILYKYDASTVIGKDTNGKKIAIGTDGPSYILPDIDTVDITDSAARITSYLVLGKVGIKYNNSSGYEITYFTGRGLEEYMGFIGQPNRPHTPSFEILKSVTDTNTTYSIESFFGKMFCGNVLIDDTSLGSDTDTRNKITLPSDAGQYLVYLSCRDSFSNSDATCDENASVGDTYVYQSTPGNGSLNWKLNVCSISPALTLTPQSLPDNTSGAYLDISRKNQESLLASIANKSIIPYLIDKERKEGHISPRDAMTVVPIAVVEKPASGIDYNKVLSLLDFEVGPYRLDSFSIGNTNTFSTLQVL